MEKTLARIESYVSEQDPKKEQDPEKRWPALVDYARFSQINPLGFRTLWDHCFVDWEVDNHSPAPLWFPTADALEHSNIAHWVRELGFSSYADFHRWSMQYRDEFWNQAIDRLGIQFRTQPQAILDDSLGTARTAWLPGASLNIVESCFQADENAIAIVAQQPGGPIREWTYRELRERSSQVANSLVDAGFKIGDSLGIVMPMTDWSVAIYLGIIMAGCNVVSIADSFAAPEIATRLNLAGAKAVFTYDHQNRAGKRLPLFHRVAAASEIPAIVLTTDSILSVDLRDQDFDWSDFLVERSDFEPVACNVQETINVLFSSGTTGDPKAIPWNHLTPIKCAIDGYCHQDIHHGDVCAWPTNLGWMMGPWLIFATLINRSTIALFEDAPMGEGFGAFIQDVKVTMLGVVPSMVKAWQATGEMEAFDWSRINVFSSTGESSQADAMFYLSSLAGIKPIIEYCGGTEIGGGYVSSVVVLPNVASAFNSVAVGLDFVLVEQDDENETKSDTQEDSVNSSVPTGNQGEVFLIPPSIGLSSRLINRDHFETYYTNTPNVSGLGQLRRHGDYFRKLETKFGSLYVAGGRADDTMNLGGIKISSAEIERVLNQTEGVVETAAIAYSKTGGPTELVVFAVTTDDPNVTELQASMNRLLKRELNPLFRIQSIQVIASMPRTASGKIMRRHLRRELGV